MVRRRRSSSRAIVDISRSQAGGGRPELVLGALLVGVSCSPVQARAELPNAFVRVVGARRLEQLRVVSDAIETVRSQASGCTIGRVKSAWNFCFDILFYLFYVFLFRLSFFFFQ